MSYTIISFAIFRLWSLYQMMYKSKLNRYEKQMAGGEGSATPTLIVVHTTWSDCINDVVELPGYQCFKLSIGS